MIKMKYMVESKYIPKGKYQKAMVSCDFYA